MSSPVSGPRSPVSIPKAQQDNQQRFLKASARKLAENILEGSLLKGKILTKSFGLCTASELRDRVTEKGNEIQNREVKRFLLTNKVAHLFQRVKNFFLTRNFLNDGQLLQLAKQKLPENVAGKELESQTPSAENEENVEMEEDFTFSHEEVLFDPETDSVEELEEASSSKEDSLLDLEPQSEKENQEQPILAEEQIVKGPKFQTVVARKTITIKALKDVAFSEDAKVEDLLKNKGESLIKKSKEKEGHYEVCYRKEDRSIERLSLTVQDEGSMFLYRGKSSPMSINDYKSLRQTIQRQNPGDLIIPPEKEGGAVRKSTRFNRDAFPPKSK